MLKRRSAVIACLAWGLAGTLLGGEGGQGARESTAWRMIAERQETAEPSELLQLLDGFLRAYPNGTYAADARFAVAELRFRRGEYAQAGSLYRAIIDAGDSVYVDDAWLRVGETRYNSGDIAGARKSWRKLADRTFGRSPLSAEALYGLALCELHDQNPLEAIRIMDRLVRKYPFYASAPQIRELLGILRYKEKSYAEAVQALRGVATPVGAFYRGLSHFHQRQYQEAAQAFNDMAQTSSGPYAELGVFQKAECFRMIQNDALASYAYGEFIRLFPNSKLRPLAAVYQARALKGQGRMQEAVALLDAVQARGDPGEIQNEAIYLRAEIAAMRGEYQKAMELIAARPAARRDQPEQRVHIHTLLAHHMLKAGKIKEAAAAMLQLIREQPRHPMGVASDILTGYQAHLRGDLQAALSSYENALLKYNYSQLSDVAMAMMLQAYFDSGRHQDLVTHANRVVSVVDSSYEAQDTRWRGYGQILIAEAYYRLKLYGEASRFYREAMKEPSLAAQSRLYLGWAMYHEGRHSEALRLGQRVVAARKAPEELRASAHLLIASSLFNLKKYAATVRTFQQFHARYPKDARVPDSWLYLGWAHRQAGKHQDALQAWNTLVKRFPEHPHAQQAQLQIGRLHFQTRRYAEAVEAFRKLLARWPTSSLAADAMWQISQAHYNARQDGAAERAYEAFLSRYPGDPRAVDAQSQLMLTRYRQAIRSKDRRLLAGFVRTYPKLGQAPGAQYALGRLAFDGRNWRQSIEDFRKLLLDYPAYEQAPLALLSVAHAQERMKDIPAAITEYRSLVQMFPDHPAALDAAMRMGTLHFSMGKYKEAAEGFRFTLEREAPKEIRLSAMYNLAVAHKKGRSYADAAEAFGQFIAAYPDDAKRVDALIELASVSRQLNDPEKAIDSYQRILDIPTLDPDVRMEAYNQLGDLHIAAGNKQKAIDSYAKLIASKPLNRDARLLGLAQLAAIYERDELWEPALEIYGHIKASGGQASWVRSAANREKELREYMRAAAGGAGAAAPAEQKQTQAAPEPAQAFVPAPIVASTQGAAAAEGARSDGADDAKAGAGAAPVAGKEGK